MAGYDERCDTFSYGMLLWSLMHEVAVPPSSASRPPLSLSPDRAVYSDLITRCWQQDPGLRPSMQVVAAETIAAAETSGLALWEPAASRRPRQTAACGMIGWTFPASLLHSLHMTHDMTGVYLKELLPEVTTYFEK